MTKLELLQLSRARVNAIPLGSPVTNICAGDDNPIRHMKFIGPKTKSYTNRYGIKHSSHYAECIDGNGKRHLVGVEVIYPGLLDPAECKQLFAPVHAVIFGATV